MEDGKAEAMLTGVDPQPAPPTEDPNPNTAGSLKPGEPEDLTSTEKIPNGEGP